MPRGRTPSPFLAQVRTAIRVHHYSIRTEEAHLFWTRRFILYHGKRYPSAMKETEEGAFLSRLAVDKNVSPSTQNQTLNALVFLYKQVLERPLGEINGVLRAKNAQWLPVVLTQNEIACLLSHLSGVHWLIACLQYGSGLRLLESVRLRVKDIDFAHRAIFVLDGKGGKDRVVTLPDEVTVPLQRHLENRKTLFERNTQQGFGTVYLPHALARKYPNAPTEWGWQYLFPATRIGLDPRSGARRRHHLDETAVQKAIRRAIRQAGIVKPQLPHVATLFRDAPA